MADLIRIGTRGSQLALWQARRAEQLLQEAGLETELVIINTKGDQIQDRALSKIGSKGVFTEELEEGLRQGEIEIAVHSAKDLPSRLPQGLEIIAFMERELVHDVVISHDKNFDFGRKDVVVGSSSTRRRAILRRNYPGINLVEARGNLQTRLEKLNNKQFDAMLLAYAGVHRMGYEQYIVQHLSAEEFIPAVGQGSVAIEAASSLTPEIKEKIANALNHTQTAQQLVAERAFLRTMEGGCSVPVFGLCRHKGSELEITGGIVSLDGTEMIKETITGKPEDGEKIGRELGLRVIDLGGGVILQKIKQQQQK